MKKYIFFRGNRARIEVQKRAHPETVLRIRSPRTMETFGVLLLVLRAWVLTYRNLGREAQIVSAEAQKRARRAHQRAFKALRKAEDKINWEGPVSWSKAVLWLCRDTLDALTLTLNHMIGQLSPSYAEWVQLRKEFDKATCSGSGSHTGQGGSEEASTRAGRSQG